MPDDWDVPLESTKKTAVDSKAELIAA